MRFTDRRQAGALLGEAVARLGPIRPVVLGLPRGGVPVAAPVAQALGCDLDVLVIRKLGVPHQPELAMGALGEGGTIVRNDEVLRLAGVSPAQFEQVVMREEAELTRRLALYRPDAGPVDVEDKTVIVVDDGLATGATARVAVAVLRERSPGQVWVAVPVAPRDTKEVMENEADRVIVLETPRFFGAVGAWYDEFKQTTDDEVRSLLIH
ncbi:MAG: phosphoribosyltransferase [Acidimicrobiia bacterium]|nr:phosphoribosyltransferase [Acidimicrobiia bacterium]